MTYGLCEMTFPHAARSEKKHAFISLDERTRRELADRWFMDLRVKREIERFESLVGCELAFREPPAHLFIVPALDFIGAEPKEEMSVFPFLLHSLTHSDFKTLEHSRELQAHKLGFQ
jgi:hypothetical protein